MKKITNFENYKKYKRISQLEKYDIKDDRSNTIRTCYNTKDVDKLLKDTLIQISSEYERYNDMPDPDKEKLKCLNAQRQLLKEIS